LQIVGPKGAREVPLEKFFIIPKSENEREHDLRPNEMITEILVPPPMGVRTAQYEVRQKATFDWPLATASVALLGHGSNVQEARIVLGHVAPIPWRAAEAEQAVAGKPVNEQTAEAAAKAAVAGAKSLGRNSYKIQLTQVAVKRALLQAVKEG
jgi:xanthine dehydrogenase YagS FAD-binding subunit